MTGDLTAVTTPVARVDRDRFRAEIPDGWQQGRGAFGGLVLGQMTRAIEEVEASRERALRSLTAEILAPVLPGSIELRVERLRAGTGVSTLAARAVQKGDVVAHAVAVLGRARAGDADHLDLAPPAMKPWRDVPVVPIGAPFGPVFAQHFEYRPTGPAPFSRGERAVASGWVRPREPGPARDAAYVVALADAWWPAIYARLSEPRPTATIAFTLELVGDCEGLADDAPLFHTAEGLVARDGYSVELRQLWGEDGRIVALNQQTFAVIR